MILQVFGGLFAALVLASAVGAWLARTRPSPAVANANARIRAWWVMIVAGGLVLALGRYAVAALFAALAWAALTEFTGRRDRWFGLVPVQFVVAVLGPAWLTALLIPLVRRDSGLLLIVWGLSWIAALPNTGLMFFFVLVVQASDVLQYLWGRAIGRTKVAPRLSPSKTVEGLIGGVFTASALGALLHGLTPFTPGSAALTSLVITLAGFASGLVFSAIKRKRGIKDWGTAIAGHGGVLDRVDSLCLSAPVFYAVLKLQGG